MVHLANYAHLIVEVVMDYLQSALLALLHPIVIQYRIISLMELALQPVPMVISHINTVLLAGYATLDVRVAATLITV
jgi:hypothetical protein